MIGWILAALVAFALVTVGVAALIAPRTTSSQYGIVIGDPRSLALIRAMGIRDVVIGVLMALLAVERARTALALAMFAGVLVALVDLAVVTADRRTAGSAGWSPPCWMHAAGAIGLLATGALLRAGL